MKLVAESFAKAANGRFERVDFDQKHEMAAKWQLWCLRRRACQTAQVSARRLNDAYQTQLRKGKMHDGFG